MVKTTNSHHPAHGSRKASERRAYRLREVEGETGIPVSTLRAMIRRGEINPITGFRTWLIAAEEYERLLNTRLRAENQISR